MDRVSLCRRARALLDRINAMNVRTVDPSDGQLIRALYLRMFADAPDAFSETLEAARAMSLEQWDMRAREYSDPSKALAWIALEGLRPWRRK